MTEEPLRPHIKLVYHRMNVMKGCLSQAFVKDISVVTDEMVRKIVAVSVS